jgi:hypothetical protein
MACGDQQRYYFGPRPFVVGGLLSKLPIFFKVEDEQG